MTDSYYVLVKAIIAELKATAAVTNVVGQRIYTDPPQKETFPYIVIQNDAVTYSTKDIAGMEHTLDVNVYSRNKSPKQASTIRAAVYTALNRQEGSISLDTGSISNIYCDTTAMFKDPDGKTWHGLASFRVVIL